jgi:glycosyltransferase involved in cell wall biosynthesis
MRIGIIIYGLDRPTTGITRYMLEFVRALAALSPQPDVTLLAAGDPGPLAQCGFPIARLPGCRLLPALATVGQAWIGAHARRLQLDLIHDLTGIGLFQWTGGAVATVTTIHDVFPLSYPGYSSQLDTLIYRHWLPRVAPSLSAVITCSEQSRRDIERHLYVSPDRLGVIPHGVRSTFGIRPAPVVRAHLRQRFGIEQPYVLYVGALTQRKNIVRALEAFARLREDLPPLHFVLAGPRTWRETPVEFTIQQLGLVDCVRLTGPVSDADLAILYNGARLFVFPSLYEGFGLPVLEAMACGAPVVTANVSSLPEVAGDAAELVDPHDVEQIAAAMRRVLMDATHAARLRNAGLRWARQFNWARTARETLSVYRLALGRRTVRRTNGGRVVSVE